MAHPLEYKLNFSLLRKKKKETIDLLPSLENFVTEQND